MQHGFMQPKWNMNYFVTGVLCCQKRNFQKFYWKISFQKVLLADQRSNLQIYDVFSRANSVTRA